MSRIPEVVVGGVDVDGTTVGAVLIQLTKHPFRPAPLEILLLLELKFTLRLSLELMRTLERLLVILNKYSDL